MKFKLDIIKKMKSGKETFRLRSMFETADRALVLFGPSGSGKTLTLQAIAGMLTPDEGVIQFNGDVMFDSSSRTNVPTRDREVGYVFQNYALFPHLSVQENIAFGLKPLFGRLTRSNRLRVQELMEVFGLEKLAGQKPSTLSGGQQQRTALARALATKPKLLLLDEPFSALDQPLQLRMRAELSRILESFNVPMIMVTHDSDEVESFADSVVIYRHGNVVGVHSAEEVAGRGCSLSEIIRSEVAMAYD